MTTVVASEVEGATPPKTTRPPRRSARVFFIGVGLIDPLQKRREGIFRMGVFVEGFLVLGSWFLVLGSPSMAPTAR